MKDFSLQRRALRLLWPVLATVLSATALLSWLRAYGWLMAQSSRAEVICFALDRARTDCTIKKWGRLSATRVEHVRAVEVECIHGGGSPIPVHGGCRLKLKGRYATEEMTSSVHGFKSAYEEIEQKLTQFIEAPDQELHLVIDPHSNL